MAIAYLNRVYNPPHATHTLEHNCRRLAITHIGLVKRRAASAIYATRKLEAAR